MIEKESYFLHLNYTRTTLINLILSNSDIDYNLSTNLPTLHNHNYLERVTHCLLL